MNIIYLFIIIIIIFNLCSSKENKLKNYILLPFIIEEKQNKEQIEYNSDIFIQEYFKKNIIFYFYLGNPPQKINGIIQNDNLCFELKNEEKLLNYKSEKYTPKYSSSFSLTSKQKRFISKEFMIIGYDLISFENINKKYNISFLLQKIDKKIIDINNISNKQYIAKIGLNKPLYYTGDQCPNFISGIKNKANLDKYTISFEFIDSNKGYIIIGDELYNYNPYKYHYSQYINSYSNKNFELFLHKTIISENDNKNILINNTYGYISYDLGVIIGTEEYKQIIDDIFFNKLISEGICQIDIVKYNISQNYYIFSCNTNNIYLNLFPKLIFVSKNYLYDFELNYSDLFIKLSNNKYYFLIIFKANNINNKSIKDIWILGQPFYKKYNFTINIDAKILGFYNPNLPIDENEKLKNDNNIKYNNDIDRSNNFLKKFIIIIFSIIFIVGLLIFTFVLGMKMKEQRKKRANELKDDNYEYLEDKKEKKFVKKFINIEMNSKIGI